jgi:hypothetical protein
MKADEFGKFKDGLQQGAKEALSDPGPQRLRVIEPIIKSP